VARTSHYMMIAPMNPQGSKGVRPPPFIQTLGQRELVHPLFSPIPTHHLWSSPKFYCKERPPSVLTNDPCSPFRSSFCSFYKL